MATKDTAISASELCEYIGVTLQHLSLLAAKGHVARASHGKYWLRQSVRAYCDYKNGETIGKKTTDAKRLPADNPRARLEDAKARIAEAEAARVEGEQIRVDVALALFADLVSNARTKLLTLDSRVPPEARIATRNAVHDALADLSQHDQSELIAQLLAQDGGSVDASAKPDGQ